MLSLPHFGTSAIKRPEPNPERDWALLVAAFLLCIVGIIAWSTFLFLEIRSGDLFRALGGNDAPVETLDRALLKEVVEAYDLKEATFKEGTGEPLADPSR
jgi:hypothetical protein